MTFGEMLEALDEMGAINYSDLGLHSSRFTISVFGVCDSRYHVTPNEAVITSIEEWLWFNCSCKHAPKLRAIVAAGKRHLELASFNWSTQLETEFRLATRPFSLKCASKPIAQQPHNKQRQRQFGDDV